MSRAPRPLVVAAHGTASAHGRRAVEACAAAAAGALGVPHAVGYVDVCGPTLDEALADLDRPVVVPYFLASGYHVRHDVPSAVAASPGAVVTAALGAEPEVVRALADRVLGAAADRVLEAAADRVLEAAVPVPGRPGARAPRPPAPAVDAVVLTAAGSSVDSARAEVALVSRLLGERLGVATGTAYLSGPGPRPVQVVTRLRREGHEHVLLAAHLLSPGHFLGRAHAAAHELGAVATDALGTHPALADLVVRRYREAVAQS